MHRVIVNNHHYLELDAKSKEFYQRALRSLNSSGVPYLVGGAYAFDQYSGISRHTKDFDIFVKKEDSLKVLDILAKSCGCTIDLSFPHWLYKAILGDNFIDVIFSSGNGVANVDEEWFRYACSAVVFGVPVKLIPAEEMIWSKSFVMERERFDGADIAHTIHSWELDWGRLIKRFESHWRVLYVHLILFGYIYPNEKYKIPDWVFQRFSKQLLSEQVQEKQEGPKICQGTLLSREQYLKDIYEWGYVDGRISEETAFRTAMTEQDVAHWTAAARGCAKK
jgi:hypothetical protein